VYDVNGSIDPIAILHALALGYAERAKGRGRDDREPLIEIAFVNRPKYGYRVSVNGVVVAQSSESDVGAAARACAMKFEAWTMTWSAAVAEAV
jgi:hypothetical protein